MTVPTHTWKSFKAYVDVLSESNRSLIFRGQARSEWRLVSTFHRLASPADPAIYWKVLSVVHDYIATWTGRSWNLNNTTDMASFVGYLQHNGFPTPLLDWTRSPYAAAFFAFEGVDDLHPQSDLVSVFAFDNQKWTDEWVPIYDISVATPHVSVLTPESRGNHKQILQQGLYTYATVRNQDGHIVDHEDRKKSANSLHAGYLQKFTISVSEKPRVLRDLDMMGISAMSLDPGVPSICRHLASTLFRSPSVGLGPTERNKAFMASLERLRENQPSSAPTQNDDSKVASKGEPQDPSGAP